MSMVITMSIFAVNLIPIIYGTFKRVMLLLKEKVYNKYCNKSKNKKREREYNEKTFKTHDVTSESSNSSSSNSDISFDKSEKYNMKAVETQQKKH